MKKIIPLKKQLTFKTNINEITSISLENTLHTINEVIEGDLIISGTYKITETSISVDDFEFKIPINIEIDNKYNCENITIDIDDFYYEIINNNILEVNIEILLNNITEKTIEKNENAIITQNKEDEMDTKQNESIEERCIEEEIEEYTTIDTNAKINNNEKEINNLFENFSDESEQYSTYYIYIVREGDSKDTIMAKYNITKEQFEEYNDIMELKIGDKIIIPEKKNARNQ